MQCLSGGKRKRKPEQKPLPQTKKARSSLPCSTIPVPLPSLHAVCLLSLSCLWFEVQQRQKIDVFPPIFLRLFSFNNPPDRGKRGAPQSRFGKEGKERQFAFREWQQQLNNHFSTAILLASTMLHISGKRVRGILLEGCGTRAQKERQLHWIRSTVQRIPLAQL